MELDQIKGIFETSDFTLADKMIRAGWVLLSVFKRDHGAPGEPYEKTYYSLGSTSANADPSKYEKTSSLPPEWLE